MKLVDDIVEQAVDGDKPIADVLRKCLVLAFTLKNDKLKDWVERELNGYGANGELPEYRLAHLFSKGNFTGPMGAWMPQRPLPLGILSKKHRDFLTPTRFNSPIASYEPVKNAQKNGHAIINWPPDLIVQYQTKFIEGYALSQAWQEVPDGFLISIVDTVRNRVLRFALEIKDELAQVEDQPAEVPPAKVDAAVVNYIFGGTNVIGSQMGNLTQVGSIVVAKGDFQGLAKELRNFGIGDTAIAELEHAITDDAKEEIPGIGKRVAGWLNKAGDKLGEAGLKVGTEVSVAVIKKLLLQFLGMDG